MPVDAKIAELLAAAEEVDPRPIEALSVAEARARGGSVSVAPVLPPEPVADVRDLIIDALPPMPARLYRPGAGTLPLLVYFHGGGWVVGSVATARPVLSRARERERLRHRLRRISPGPGGSLSGRGGRRVRRDALVGGPRRRPRHRCVAHRRRRIERGRQPSGGRGAHGARTQGAEDRVPAAARARRRSATSTRRRIGPTARDSA